MPSSSGSPPSPVPSAFSLARVELDGVGPFDQAVIDLPAPGASDDTRLLLLEGPNGSGKTTLLEGLAVLLGCSRRWPVNRREWDYAAQEPRLKELLQQHAKAESWQGKSNAPPTLPPYAQLWARMRTGTANIKAILARADEQLVLEVGSADGWRSSSDQGPIYPLLDEYVSQAERQMMDRALTWAAFAFRGYQASPLLKAGSPGEIAQPPLRGAMSFGEYGAGSVDLGKFLLNLDYYRAREGDKASRAKDPEEKLRHEGAAAARTEAIQRFERTLGQLLDVAVRIEFPDDTLGPRILFDGEPIPPELLGEGMRQTVAWVTDLLVRIERIRWARADLPPTHQPFWLLLDEIDQGLHPKLQVRILPALRTLFPNATIIATTHSPFMVASAGDGHVVSLRANRERHVTGTITPRRLDHGQSLEWVIGEVFDTDSLFVDPETLERLEIHRQAVDTLRRGRPVKDWETFVAARTWLLSLGEEVRAIVAMREAPVRDEIERRVAESRR